jgi:thioredoxin 1
LCSNECKSCSKSITGIDFTGIYPANQFCAKHTQGVTHKQATEPKQAIKYKVTFIELGSVRCIPCQKNATRHEINRKQNMGKEVNVVFHDVWTPEGQRLPNNMASNPFQHRSFLDENGKEFARHVGYFSKKNL